VAAGATVVAGGMLPAEHTDQAKDGPGVPQFYPPTIVILPSILSTPSQRGLALLREEVFGPVITAMRFETDEVLLGTLPLTLTLTLDRRGAAARPRDHAWA